MRLFDGRTENREPRIQSRLMSAFRWLRADRIAWSLRRLYCPVDKQALVLEVGSGGNPYPRANVLLDAYEETRERHWEPLVADRPTVLGKGERLPFRDKAFDFVIASHVCEHTADPEKFLMELQRVAKAGYIEVPDAFMERINPYRDHRLEITCREGRLIIRKKFGWIVDKEVVELYEQHAKRVVTGDLLPRRPFEFHVRFYWKEQIPFVVVNPEVNAGWLEEGSPPVHRTVGKTFPARLRSELVNAIRWLFSQNRRNRRIDLLSLMICPECGSDELRTEAGYIRCDSCANAYAIKKGVLVMHRPSEVAEDSIGWS